MTSIVELSRGVGKPMNVACKSDDPTSLLIPPNKCSFSLGFLVQFGRLMLVTICHISLCCRKETNTSNNSTYKNIPFGTFTKFHFSSKTIFPVWVG